MRAYRPATIARRRQQDRLPGPPGRVQRLHPREVHGAVRVRGGELVAEVPRPRPGCRRATARLADVEARPAAAGSRSSAMPRSIIAVLPSPGTASRLKSVTVSSARNAPLNVALGDRRRCRRHRASARRRRGRRSGTVSPTCTTSAGPAGAAAPSSTAAVAGPEPQQRGGVVGRSPAGISTEDVGAGRARTAGPAGTARAAFDRAGEAGEGGRVGGRLLLGQRPDRGLDARPRRRSSAVAVPRAVAA